MKRFYTIITIVSVVILGLTCAYATDNYAKFSSKFMKHFQDCDKYEETVSSEFEGKTFTSEHKIFGWRNGMCRYQETIKSVDGNYQLNCAFSNIQTDDLYNAMKSKSKELEKYELETFAEQTDEKTGKIKYVQVGTTTIKGNKAYIAWAKVLNNPYFCKPQKL